MNGNKAKIKKSSHSDGSITEDEYLASECDAMLNSKLQPEKGRSFSLRWKIASAVIVVLVVTYFLVIAIFSQYHTTVPTKASYLPDDFNQSPIYAVSWVDFTDGTNKTAEGKTKKGGQSLYRSVDSFVRIDCTYDISEPPPEGEEVEAMGEKAVLATGVSGFAAAPEGFEDELEGFAYSDAKKLVWILNGTQIEILSDLEEEELLKVAEGLKNF